MMPMDESPQAEGQVKDAEQGPGEDPNAQDDPMKALGAGIMAMVDGLSKASPEVAKAAQAVGAAYQQLMQVLGGAGPQGPAPAPGAQMSGGNPNAVPVR